MVKVADFGLSRELILCDYYRLCHNKTPVPVRWMAPECLEANVFTTMSDVVSIQIKAVFRDCKLVNSFSEMFDPCTDVHTSHLPFSIPCQNFTNRDPLKK